MDAVFPSSSSSWSHPASRTFTEKPGGSQRRKINAGLPLCMCACLKYNWIKEVRSRLCIQLIAVENKREQCWHLPSGLLKIVTVSNKLLGWEKKKKQHKKKQKKKNPSIMQVQPALTRCRTPFESALLPLLHSQSLDCNPYEHSHLLQHSNTI